MLYILYGSIIMATATLISGDVHIPSTMLQRHGMKDGARVIVEDTQEGILITPLTVQRQKEAIARAAGLLPPGSKVLDRLLEERRRDRENEDRAIRP